MISRRKFLKCVSVTAATLPVLNLNCGYKKKKPNIIYILADDLGYGDLGCYGQTKIKTAHLAKMAAAGMRFTQHYAGSTVCAPSRCSLFTGKHTGSCYIRGNYETEGYQLALPQTEVTIANCLKQAGYNTGLVGKWGLGGPESAGHPNRHGFDYFFGYLGQVQAHFYYPPHLWENDEKVELVGNQNGQKEIYSHDLVTEKACNFIETNAQKPFFLCVTYTIPHAELVAPEHVISEYEDKFAETPYIGRHYGSQEKPRAAYAAMVSHMDKDIGRIRELLKKLDLTENTLIMFSSDNGPHREGGNDPQYFKSSGPFRGIKRDLYEGGIRVPMIACWPGTVNSSTISNHISAFWDILPTCCELAGIEEPKNLDGISFVNELSGKKQAQHEYLYWEFHEGNGAQAVRMGKWKGVRTGVKQNPDNFIELYNLDADPGEADNITKHHPDIVKQIDIIMAVRSKSEIAQWNFIATDTKK